MPYLKLKLLSSSVIDQNDDCCFTEVGGSIGRAKDCDWTLIDADRFISKKHLVISFREQQFVLTDVSSNGVVINNASAPLGRDNEHVLQTSDTLMIGKHSVQVEKINTEVVNTSEQQENNVIDGDLLGLVMGAESDPAPQEKPQNFFQTPEKPDFRENNRPAGNLGLDDILSEPIKSPSDSGNTPIPQSNSFNQSPSVHVNSPLNAPGDNSPKAKDSVIPDDWEMFDISDFKPANQTQESSMPRDNIKMFSEEPIRPDPQPVKPVKVEPNERVDTPTPAFPSDVSDTNNEFPVTPPSFETPTRKQQNEIPVAPVAKVGGVSALGDDAFFAMLYEKLGLPKEFISTIDKETFADDIVTVLLSTTQGLMSLLASRTAFKQESRLSATLIQPRSNNPIKFSIDPVDTLEMLFVKKKKGYMTTGDAYNEALKDIQLHQMAFMSGLQGTLVGLLAELDPVIIEKQANKNSKGFMGLNSNSQCWQLYKEKQSSMAKSVTENLNDILGSYFSDAYQSQINKFKNEK